MQNIRVFSVCEVLCLERVLGCIKDYFLHHPVQAKYLHFNPYIYILYYDSNMSDNLTPSPACYHFKIISFLCNWGVGTAVERNLYLGRYIVEYTVANLVLRRRAREEA